MRRTVHIGHASEALEAIIRVLESLNMGARTEWERPAEAPALPWKRVLAAGLLALGSEAAEFASGPDLLVLGLALAAILLGGLGTYKNGWIALKDRNLNMNALMSCRRMSVWTKPCWMPLRRRRRLPPLTRKAR